MFASPLPHNSMSPLRHIVCGRREAAGNVCERVALIIHCTQLRGSKLMNKTLRDIRPRRIFTCVIGSPHREKKILVRLKVAPVKNT